jgi:negative regulator of flagellin synthesis FlgM
MSYSNGIGDLKQALSAITTASTTEMQQIASGKTKETSPATSRESHADEARLSSTGGLIAQALEGSDVRPAKVAALQQAIANGAYNVSSSDVAGKMIQSLLD